MFSLWWGTMNLLVFSVAFPATTLCKEKQYKKQNILTKPLPKPLINRVLN